MRVHEIMHHVVSVAGGRIVADVARKMEAEGVDSVLVYDKGRVGICTERDILRKIVAAGKDPAAVKVADIMTSPLRSISWETHAEDASDMMNELKIRRLVVMQNSEIVGIVSATCIAKNVRYITARRLLAPESLTQGVVL